MNYVECVPNFSEGRRPDVISAIRDAIAAVEGVAVLDVSSDESHNRSVITFVSPVGSAVEAALAGARVAAESIDLTRHTGEHPRIGATDVVPFVPVGDTSMDDCVQLARDLGKRMADQLGIPVFLYERAAARPERTNLAAVRKGQFEGLRDVISTDPLRSPDFGPHQVHPTAGATAVGARPVLVAYNVYLGNADNVPLAKKIATGIRESSGGLPAVKAMGLLVDGQAQVSMNLVDIDRTSVQTVFDEIVRRARDEGVDVTWSEVVGLVPERALLGAGRAHLKLDRFSEEQILEARVRQSTSGKSIEVLLAELGSSSPTPGGGTAAAYAGSIAAALARMVATLTVGRKKYAEVDAVMRQLQDEASSLSRRLVVLAERDAQAYEMVSEAYKLPKDSDELAAARTRAIDRALLYAAEVPLESARACARVAALAADAAARGNRNAISDSGVAALLALAACRGAAYNVFINVAALSDKSAGSELESAARALVDSATASCDSATRAVENSLG